MCCGCERSIGNCSSNLAYVLEKLASFVAMTAVISCIVITLTISLGIGVGLGYNYCFVDLKVMTGLLARLDANSWWDKQIKKRKITLYATCTGLICCLMLTITVTLGMGIGLGYNYCFVDMKTKFKLKGYYSYPVNSRWPYSKRQGDAAEEPALDETVEDDALRRSPQEPDRITSIPDDMDPRELRERTSHFNNTGNGTTTDYHPTLPDSESFNGTESTVKTTVDAPTNAEVTEITENNPETNSSSSTNTSTIGDKTELINETYEPTPLPSIVNEEQLKSSPSSRKVKKLVIPISGLDLISLLSKLKAENRNYSLQIVTT